MAQTLDHNGSIKQVSAMPVPVFDEDMDIIQKLDDEPNDVGGLTAAQLKAEFDAAGRKTKDYINNELIPAIIAEGLTEEARSLAEAERVANEMERVSNEETRIESFEAMQQETDGVLALVEKLAVAVNTLSPGTAATATIAVDPVTGGYKITFGIPRGADGQGTGDMKKSVYDPSGKQMDVFKYVDDVVDNLPSTYTYGTEDLEAGVTPLESGKLHFVYE